jgi:hypothetical protein
MPMGGGNERFTRPGGGDAPRSEPFDSGQRRTHIESKDVQMKLRSAGVVGALMCLAGCGHSAQEVAPPPEATRQATPHPAVQHGAHQGSLTAHERTLATKIAKRQQREVIGTLIGAIAFATHGTPFDPGSACDLDERLLNVRLVWKADANFVHASMPNSLPDGPRKGALITVDPTNGHVCETGAQYREVGADDNETLLYGQWPDPADG